MKQLKIFILSLLLIFLLGLSSNAQEVVLVYPNVIELDFNKNKSKFVSKIIYVENPTNKPLRVRTYKQDWDLNEYGNIIFEALDETYSLKDYIRFNPREFTLQPGQKQLVRLSGMLSPEKVGEYRTLIFFEIVKPKEQIITAPNKQLSVIVNFKARFGVALYAYNGDVKKSAEILNVDFEVFQEKPNILVTLKNDGNIHCNVEGYLSLKNKETDETFKLEFPRYTILPERTQQARIFIPQSVLKNSTYETEVVLTYEDIQEKKQVVEALKSLTYEGPLGKPSIKKVNKTSIEDENIKKEPGNISKPILIDESDIELDF